MVGSNLKSTFEGKRVFVTGATGFKGAWLGLLLKELGSEVTGYSIDIPTQPSLFESLGGAKLVNDVRGDILDAKALTAAMVQAQPDIVLHLAAQPLVRRSFREPILTIATNVVGTAQVLESAKTVSSVRAALIVTTDKVYESTPSVHPRREDDRLGGDDPYSASKACAEIVTQSYFHSFYREAGIRVASVRAGNVIGGGDWAEDRILPDLVRAAQSGRPLHVRSPHSVRPWQHVLEPLTGYLLTVHKLLEGSIANGETFNFGPRPESHVPVSRLLECVKPHFPEVELHVDHSGKAATGEMLELRLDWQKAYRLMQWRPLLSLEESLDWTCQWYRQYLESPDEVRPHSVSQIHQYLTKAQVFL